MSAYPSASPSAEGVPVQSAAWSDRSFVATWLFSWLLGFLGVDRFYLGKVGTGLLKLLTFGGLGIWWLIDLILTLAGVQRDKEGRLLPDFQEHKMMAWIVTAIVFGLWAVATAFSQMLVYIPRNVGPMMPWWPAQ
jgi:hypothetical protein